MIGDNVNVGAFTGTRANAAGLRPSRRLPELDGLRALAILPVILSHCYPETGWWRWTSFLGKVGWMGVDLFFVLSGYLITGILLDTVDRKDYYRNFIIRRTLRIFPLYYVCLALFTVVTKLTEHSQWGAIRTWGGVGWFFAYLGNIHIAWMNAMPPIFSFSPLWSLQIEEQFYLLYPAIVLFLSQLRLRNLLMTCVVAAPLLRSFLLFFVTGSGEARLVLTPCRMDSLALGGLVALLVRSPLAQGLTLTQVRTGALVTGSAVLCCAVVSADLGSPIMSSVGYTVIDIASSLFLIMVVLWPSSRPAKWLRWRPLVYTGRIAYGLYLLHGPSSWAVRSVIESLTGIEIKGHSGLSVPVTFVSAFIAAGLSWRFFESPILSLKERLTGLD
jgi:peptidoglycan/LPS O-acetylase OafA/YrhL